MLSKEEKLELKEQEREYREKEKQHREDLKQLKTEQKQEKKGSGKKSGAVRKTRRKKPRQTSGQSKILSVFPIRDYLDREGCFITDRNTMVNLFQIQGRCYYDASDDEIENLVYSNAKFLQKYPDDFKIIGMNYPTNTKQQQDFLSHMLKRPDLRQFSGALQKKLESLQKLEQNTTDRQAFLMVFAKDRGRYRELLRLLSGNPCFVIKPVSREKKENIIFQLNNMNKKIKV